MRERKDFVNARLSAAGRAHAGNGETVRVANGRMHYVFIGEAPVEVLRRGEWDLLAAELDAEGRPLFEVFEPAPAKVEGESEESNA